MFLRIQIVIFRKLLWSLKVFCHISHNCISLKTFVLTWKRLIWIFHRLLFETKHLQLYNSTRLILIMFFYLNRNVAKSTSSWMFFFENFECFLFWFIFKSWVFEFFFVQSCEFDQEICNLKILEYEFSIKIDEFEKRLRVFQVSRRRSIDDHFDFDCVHFDFFCCDYEFQIFHFFDEKLAFVDVQIKTRFLKFNKNFWHVIHVFFFAFSNKWKCHSNSLYRNRLNIRVKWRW